VPGTTGAVALPEPAFFSVSSFDFNNACFLASSASLNLTNESPPWCDAKYANVIDVNMNMVAAPAVKRRKNVEAPEPPNTVAALPPPPKAPPMPPPLPDCSKTVSIKNKHIETCTMVTRVDMGKRVLAQS